MHYDSHTRDRYRLAVRATTATVAAGAMAATGWLTGAAAQEGHAKAIADQKAALEAQAAAAALQKPKTILRERPTTTRVTTRYITAARPSGSVGGGGSVNDGSDGGGGDRGGGGDGGQSQGNSAPDPPSAPTSGS